MSDDFAEAIVCAACGWRCSQIAEAIGHEHYRHEGAQTCWWQREDPSGRQRAEYAASLEVARRLTDDPALSALVRERLAEKASQQSEPMSREEFSNRTSRRTP